MRERINRLARGILDAEAAVPAVTPERLELPIRCGEKQRVAFSVDSANDVFLKGLAYSDHVRVRVLRSSFGGRKNQLFLEVDAEHLEAGTVIEGRISLVTDGGERELPFRFPVEEGPGGAMLERLTSVSLFAEIAARDPEAGLRIFEYRDFVTAPFMRNLRLRALYEAFRKGSDRESAMEEFLIAAGAKKSAVVRAETEACSFDFEEGREGRIRLLCVRDGCFRLTVQAEGAFIRLSKTFLSSGEFEQKHYDFVFTVDETKLHQGRNEGGIRFEAEAMSFRVPVSVFHYGAHNKRRNSRMEHAERRRAVIAYSSLRLRRLLSETPERALPQEEPALKELMTIDSEHASWPLLLAEIAFRRGERDQCESYLSLAAELLKKQGAAPGLQRYGLEAMRAILANDADRKMALARTLKQEVEKGRLSGAITLILLLDPGFREDRFAFPEFLQLEYRNGNRSPSLYGEWAKLCCRCPDLIRTLGAEACSVLRFSLRYGQITAETAAAYTRAAAALRSFLPLHTALFCGLYHRFPTGELLTLICTALIRQDQRTEEAYHWYRKGVTERIRLTGLNEYLIYSMPSHDSDPLPHEVFLYFAYDNRLDDKSREKLYENLCRYQKQEPELWEEYRRQIEEFALNRLLAGEVNRRLAVLYRDILYIGMVDRRLAAVLPAILNTRRIRVKSDWIRTVLVLYPELKETERVRLEGGAAYVPVYSSRAIFLFEDFYGNRFASVPWSAEQVCEMPALLQRCIEVDPDAPVQILGRLQQIRNMDSEGKSLSPEEVRTVRYALDHLKLSDAYRTELRSLLVSNASECLDYLLTEDKRVFTQKERSVIFTAMVRHRKWREAWDLFCDYRMPDLPEDALSALCSQAILAHLGAGEEDSLLMLLSRRVFCSGRADAVILDYLCEGFNGPGREMLRLMQDAVRAEVECHDLEERLIVQMLFTGETEGIEQVFVRYRESGRASEAVVRAYITDRCARCFRQELVPEEGVFRYLELLLSGHENKSALPLIYRLSLLCRYAQAETLTEEQIGLAKALLPGLLEEKIYLSCFKKFNRFFALPQDFMDKEMLEFRGKTGGSYEVEMRILPDQTEFCTKKLQHVYLDCYLRREVLFEGERWEYRIKESGGNGESLCEGVITCGSGKPETSAEDVGEAQAEQAAGEQAPVMSRYDCLNFLSRCLREQDETRLRAGMEEFATQEDLAAMLFQIDTD